MRLIAILKNVTQLTALIYIYTWKVTAVRDDIKQEEVARCQ